MWHFRTWFSGGLDSVRLIIRLDGLRGLFHLKLYVILWFYDLSLARDFLRL